MSVNKFYGIKTEEKKEPNVAKSEKTVVRQPKGKAADFVFQTQKPGYSRTHNGGFYMH